MISHVMPRHDDLDWHTPDADCRCRPDALAREEQGGWTFIHHVLDGREIAEPIHEAARA